MIDTIAPTLTPVDVVLTLSNLWEISNSAFFVDTSEMDYLACSITCFRGKDRATVGIVYTKGGGAARIFDEKMRIVGQTVEKMNQEDYHGIRNMMLDMQKDLPVPAGISPEDLA